MADRPVITPDLKVGQLLDAYPELEAELVAIAPAFEKLRNPLLRRTVARLTSLRQAAQVGGVSLGAMIGRLRRAAGIAEEWRDDEGTGDAGRPGWLDLVEVVTTHDARQEIEQGGHPLPGVMAALEALQPGQAHVLITPFVPAPLLDRARERGFAAWSETVGAEEFRSTFALLRP
jgi:hypothetical protein